VFREELGKGAVVVTEHDVVTGYRVRLFTLAEELGNVSDVCRLMRVHRSTYYRRKRQVDRWGLEALNVRERRRPRMPNQIGPHIEQRIVAFALAHPGFGPRLISAELAREKWGGLRISEHGVWRVLVRLGLNTRTKRLALVARHRDPYERAPSPLQPPRHIDATRPGEKVGVDCFFIGRLSGSKARSGSTPRSTSPPATPGRSCTAQTATPGAATAPPCYTRSHTNSPKPAGNSNKSSATTAPSSAAPTSATPSTR
jgi:hypothetical protein